MYTLDRVLEAAGYRVSGGAEHLWACFPSARYIDLSSEHGTGGVLFNTEDRMVYEVTVSDTDGDTSYRWINPEYHQAYVNEAAERGIDPDIAWDETKHSDTQSFDDILAKLQGILNNEEFDRRVVVEFDLPEEVFLELAREAHRRDITMNDMIAEVLRLAIDGKLGDI